MVKGRDKELSASFVVASLHLIRIVQASYGPGKIDQILRLLGRCIDRPQCIPNEIAAMELISNHTSIPIWRDLELYDHS